MMKRKIKRRHGFTLVELLVVIALISILSAVAIAVINPAAMMGKSRDASRKSDLKAIQGAIELYYSQNRNYPVTAPNFGGVWTAGGTTYLNNTPQDPKSGWGYCYAGRPTSCNNTTSICTGYLMCAGVEDVSNDNFTGTVCSGLNASRAGEFCVTNPF